MSGAASIAVITGAGSGLGKALALRLSRQHRVVLTDIDELSVQGTLKAVRDAGGHGEVHVISVTEEKAWEELRDHVYAEFGHVYVDHPHGLRGVDGYEFDASRARQFREFAHRVTESDDVVDVW